MPIYEYECKSCSTVQEVLQKISDPAPAECPSCHKGPLVKLLSRTGFILKGNGWYVTDFRDGGKKAASGASEGSSGASSGSSSSSASSSESASSSSSSDSSSTTSSTPSSSAKDGGGGCAMGGCGTGHSH
jgi:putative FmdB family regulatory protein